MNTKLKKALILIFVVLIAAMPGAAMAKTTPGSGGGEALPWEGPLESIVKSLTGFWAYAVIVIAFVASAAMMFFGQAEMQGWVRNLIFLIMVCSMLVGGGVLAEKFFGLAGMLIQ